MWWAYIWGAYIRGGLIVGGLRYACIKAPFTLYRITFHTGNVHSVSEVKNNGVYTMQLHSV
jgi:hypothetical protein